MLEACVDSVTGLEECWECQQYYIVRGFTSPIGTIHAWSDRAGRANHSSLESINPCDGWNWKENSVWAIDFSWAAELDQSGWSYATTFSHLRDIALAGGVGSCGVKKPAHFYRRRRWVRQRTCDGVSAEAEIQRLKKLQQLKMIRESLLRSDEQWFTSLSSAEQSRRTLLANFLKDIKKEVESIARGVADGLRTAKQVNSFLEDLSAMSTHQSKLMTDFAQKYGVTCTDPTSTMTSSNSPPPAANKAGTSTSTSTISASALLHSVISLPNVPSAKSSQPPLFDPPSPPAHPQGPPQVPFASTLLKTCQTAVQTARLVSQTAVTSSVCTTSSGLATSYGTLLEWLGANVAKKAWFTVTEAETATQQAFTELSNLHQKACGFAASRIQGIAEQMACAEAGGYGSGETVAADVWSAEQWYASSARHCQLQSAELSALVREGASRLRTLDTEKVTMVDGAYTLAAELQSLLSNTSTSSAQHPQSPNIHKNIQTPPSTYIHTPVHEENDNAHELHINEGGKSPQRKHVIETPPHHVIEPPPYDVPPKSKLVTLDAIWNPVTAVNNTSNNKSSDSLNILGDAPKLAAIRLVVTRTGYVHILPALWGDVDVERDESSRTAQPAVQSSRLQVALKDESIPDASSIPTPPRRLLELTLPARNATQASQSPSIYWPPGREPVKLVLAPTPGVNVEVWAASVLDPFGSWLREHVPASYTHAPKPNPTTPHASTMNNNTYVNGKGMNMSGSPKSSAHVSSVYMNTHVGNSRPKDHTSNGSLTDLSGCLIDDDDDEVEIQLHTL